MEKQNRISINYFKNYKVQPLNAKSTSKSVISTFKKRDFTTRIVKVSNFKYVLGFRLDDTKHSGGTSPFYKDIRLRSYYIIGIISYIFSKISFAQFTDSSVGILVSFNLYGIPSFSYFGIPKG